MKKRINEEEQNIKRITRQKIYSQKLEKYNNKEVPIIEEPIFKKKKTTVEDQDIPIEDEVIIDDEPIIEEKENITTNNKDNISKNIIIVIFILITLLLISIATIPRITFKKPEINIRYNQKYIDNDYQAKSLFKDYTKKIKIKNKINNKKIGDYEVEYSLKFTFFKIKKTKNVKVIDDVKPNINLKGNNPAIVCPGKKYVELGFEAIDEYDGNLTDKTKVDNKKDQITYKVKDKSNNTQKITRKIIYEDKEKPKIELKGNLNVTLYIGSQYIEAGYTAKDNCDGDITSKVKITGTVDNNQEGTYTINYKVTDSSNNETIVTRKVEVKNWSVIRPSSGGNGRGIVYLTFDDGPNEGTTNKILDVLKEEGVQATFFVTCNGPDYLIKRMHNEGHTVALHTATHNYNYVYSSVNNYFNDLNKVSSRVKNITGIDSKIIRFPGGSSNTISKRISPGIMTTLTSEVKKRGYKYFDWNVDSNDAAGANTNSVFNNVINNISINRENIVLMHDIKTTTRDAIRNIIRYGKSNGFTFRKITNDTVMVTHGVNN